MAADRGFPWGGLLMVIIGVWLLLQTVAGDLPGRLRSHAQKLAS